MRATFLGTADGHTRVRRSHSGIYLQTSNLSLLLDCGANAAQFLVKNRIEAEHPQAIWLSHMHSDHVGQFPLLIQSLWLRSRKSPLHIYAPSAAIPTLQDYLTKCILFPGLIGFPIRWHGIKVDKKISLAGLTLRAFPTDHLLSLKKRFQTKYPQTSFDCFGVILEVDGEQVIYTGDLASPQELGPYLKKPTRSLICELTHFPEKSLFTELSRGQTIQQTFITHYPDELDKQQNKLRQLSKDCGFPSKIILVKDGKSYLI